MTEKVNVQSKYAAKRFAKVEKEAASVSEEGQNVSETDKTAASNFTKSKKKFDLPPFTARFPEHVVRIALLIKNNAEIRRFTALGILNYLLQKGEIQGENRYVSFKWNKFAVKSNGLMREYSYNEPFFLNCLVASFTSFSASAQRTIDHFCKTEMSVDISKAVDKDEVETITALNDKYQNSEVEVEED